MLRSLFRFCLPVMGVLLACPARLPAQTRALPATTVQLPTFRFFAVSTTVEVPDSGSGFAGGTSSSASGQSQHAIPGLGFAPFANGAGGATAQGGGVGVSATVHDLDAMDRRQLGIGFDFSGHDPSADDPAVQRLPLMLRPIAQADGPRHIPTPLTTDAAGSESLAGIRAQQAADDAAKQAEAAGFFQQAREMEAAGKPGVAKIYYRMAARRATGQLKDQAQAELQRLSPPAQPASTGHSSAR